MQTFVDKTALEIQEERNAYELNMDLEGWEEQQLMTGGTYSGIMLTEDLNPFGGQRISCRMIHLIRAIDYTWIDIFQDNARI